MAVAVTTVTGPLVLACVDPSYFSTEEGTVGDNVGAFPSFTTTFAVPARQGQVHIKGGSKAWATMATTIDVCGGGAGGGPDVVTRVIITYFTWTVPEVTIVEGTGAVVFFQPVLSDGDETVGRPGNTPGVVGLLIGDRLSGLVPFRAGVINARIIGI